MNYLTTLLHQWQTQLSELSFYYPEFQVEILEANFLQAYSGKWTFVFNNNGCAAQSDSPGQTVIYGPETNLETLIIKHNLPTVPTPVEISVNDMINLLMISDIPLGIKEMLRRHIEFNSMRDLNVLRHIFAELTKTENPMALQILPLIK